MQPILFVHCRCSQDETPLLYSLVFGEGVVNDSTSVVLFNAIESFDMSSFDPKIGLHFLGDFLYMSTSLCVATGLLSAYIIKKLYFGRVSILCVSLMIGNANMVEVLNWKGVEMILYPVNLIMNLTIAPYILICKTASHFHVGNL
ncbi:unnamed protein product [Cuscuta europaea]|uniref:Uncharacterized protein n=1 Tax=Cuscuta europaea TaxID=41803 RepID=A0A9P0Z8D0_CUSEU|nr:unnamed protein product [Cuscuta europaea]